MTEQPRTVRRLDSQSLRGLAHPLRIRILGILRTEGPATATQLARALGESSGTTSWHLRQLAEHQFIEEVPDLGNKRERWWRASQQSTLLEYSPELLAGPETREALDVYLHEVLALQYQRAHAYFVNRGDWPLEWTKAATTSDWDLRLTATEAQELEKAIERLIESYRRPARPGDEPVSVQVQLFPRMGEGGRP
jgi:DNA-binding transcriptional ArsR family regulator